MNAKLSEHEKAKRRCRRLIWDLLSRVCLMAAQERVYGLKNLEHELKRLLLVFPEK